MKKNLSALGRSFVLGALLAGSVGVGGAIAAPSKALEQAIRQAVPTGILQNQDLLNRTEYFVGKSILMEME
jgi:hypothetical protein